MAAAHEHKHAQETESQMLQMCYTKAADLVEKWFNIASGGATSEDRKNDLKTIKDSFSMFILKIVDGKKKGKLD